MVLFVGAIVKANINGQGCKVICIDVYVDDIRSSIAEYTASRSNFRSATVAIFLPNGQARPKIYDANAVEFWTRENVHCMMPQCGVTTEQTDTDGVIEYRFRGDIELIE